MSSNSMSKQQELQALNVSHPAPTITEHDQEGTDIYDDDTANSGGCFRLFCCCDNHEYLYQHESGELINKETWFMKRAKSLKEYSEMVAGPKWKNFIRRFSRRPKTRANAHMPFQYDPQSYALNFNDGDDREDDDLLPRSFSTRFAPPSRSI
ncbi:hypothetical protein QVD17_22948 [Tagetes erecta]|uniref:Uncharacterized protein n=1 Tax=Tagetes erecta TaxID=13708 RepID=A0AAD8KJY0_TARER|nr:hypothetical protein QVD17_22948 [Tagetes erecta]